MRPYIDLVDSHAAQLFGLRALRLQWTDTSPLDHNIDSINIESALLQVVKRQPHLASNIRYDRKLSMARVIRIQGPFGTGPVKNPNRSDPGILPILDNGPRPLRGSRDPPECRGGYVTSRLARR